MDDGCEPEDCGDSAEEESAGLESDERRGPKRELELGYGSHKIKEEENGGRTSEEDEELVGCAPAEDADSPETDEPAESCCEAEFPWEGEEPSAIEDEDGTTSSSPTVSLPGPVEESLPELESPEQPTKAISVHAKKVEFKKLLIPIPLIYIQNPLK